MRVAIYKKDSRGCVDYNPYTKDVFVHHPDKDIRRRVYNYLTKEQSFKLGGGSGEVGDFTVVKEVPTKETYYFELALCMLYQNTRVHVDWSDKDNTGYHSSESDDTKSIAKSLDGVSYRLI